MNLCDHLIRSAKMQYWEMPVPLMEVFVGNSALANKGNVTLQKKWLNTGSTLGLGS